MSRDNDTEQGFDGRVFNSRPRKKKPRLCEIQSKALARKLFTGRDYQMYVLYHWGQGTELPYDVKKLCARISPPVKPARCYQILKALHEQMEAAEAEILKSAEVLPEQRPDLLVKEKFRVVQERNHMGVFTTDTTPQRAFGHEMDQRARVIERIIDRRLSTKAA